jgi:hypothetical protein
VGLSFLSRSKWSLAYPVPPALGQSRTENVAINALHIIGLYDVFVINGKPVSLWILEGALSIVFAVEVMRFMWEHIRR